MYYWLFKLLLPSFIVKTCAELKLGVENKLWLLWKVLGNLLLACFFRFYCKIEGSMAKSGVCISVVAVKIKNLLWCFLTFWTLFWLLFTFYSNIMPIVEIGVCQLCIFSIKKLGFWFFLITSFIPTFLSYLNNYTCYTSVLFFLFYLFR